MKSLARPGILLASAAFAATALVGCGSGSDAPAKTTTPAAAPAKQAAPPAAQPSAGGAAADPASPTPSATAPAADPSASPAGAGGNTPVAPAAGGQDVVVGGKEVSGLPPGFPFPAGSEVDTVLAGSMVVLTQPGSAEIADFYRAELPKAGFTVDLDTGGPNSLLLFSNAGWTGQIAMNTGSGATLTWSVNGSTPTTPSSDAPSPAATQGPSGPVVLGSDGLSNGDFNLPFPTGTQLADLVDEADKAAFSFTSPGPAQVLDFYRTALQGSADFTIDSDQTSGSTTTLAWHSKEADIVLVVDAASARMTLTPRG